MKLNHALLISLLSFTLLINACSKEDTTPPTTAPYYSSEEWQTLQATLSLSEDLPDYNLFEPYYLSDPLAPDINSGQAVLGRVLFYDKALSRNQEVSCASCHQQNHAFADPVAFSEGFNGELTRRNAFALGSVFSSFQTYGSPEAQLFWDNRASTIHEQILETLQNPVEMGMDMALVLSRVREKDYYSILFDKAYGTKEVTEQRLLTAIAAFINSIKFVNTRFDAGKEEQNATSPKPDTLSNFTASENLGMNLFETHCASCHGENHFRTGQSANNGLDGVYADQGIGELTNLADEMGVFKVPLLRNIELSAPYMHDGRFETLEEVVEHYNSGLQNHPNLHPELKDFSGSPKKLNLRDEEKKAIVDYLKTLTDTKIVNDERFSDPFK